MRMRRQRGDERREGGRGEAWIDRRGRARENGSQRILKGTTIKIIEEERGVDEKIQLFFKDVQKERGRR